MRRLLIGVGLAAMVACSTMYAEEVCDYLDIGGVRVERCIEVQSCWRLVNQGRVFSAWSDWSHGLCRWW